MANVYDFDATATPTTSTATSIQFAAATAGLTIELVGTGLGWNDGTDVLTATTFTSVRVLSGTTVLQTLTFDSTVTDAARVTAFNVAATGGASIDAILAGNDTISISTSDTGTIDGGTGTDTVSFQDLSTAVNANLSTGAVTGGAGTRSIVGVENLIGSAAITADTLTGDAGNNILDGGVDTVRDNLNGGDGDDTYVLRDASGGTLDAIFDSAGTDIVTSTIDRDLTAILAEIENVVLEAGAGDISAYGSSLNVIGNTLTGNEGANTLDGRFGSDTLIGGAGDDTYYVNNYTDANSGLSYTDTITEVDAILTVSQGNDTVIVESSYTLAAGVSVEVMETKTASGTGAFALTGNEFVQSITGNVGNNILDGGTTLDLLLGAVDDGVIDTLTGGAGNDTYVIRDQAGSTLDLIVEDASAGSDTIKSTVDRDLADATFDNIENIVLTGTDAANATGDDANNVLYGNDGDNVLEGKAGTDILKGFLGADTFVWDGAGRDVAQDFTAADDLVSLVTMNIGDYSTLQALAFATNGGLDTTLRTVNNSVVHTLALKGLAVASMTSSLFTFQTATTADTLNGTVHDDYLFGAGGNDTLLGDAGVDALYGEADNDTLNGGVGNDRMYGGAGDDAYYVDSLSDRAYDGTGAGTDTIYTSISLTLPAVSGSQDIENLATTNVAGTDNLNLFGNSKANTISGNAGNNIMNGGTGIDSMNGYGGNDTYYVDNAAEVIGNEGAGQGTADRVYTSVNYTLGTGDGIEFFNATGSSALTITGNELAQTITGNGANNVINGGAGIDSLYGGLGNDAFVFNTALGSTNIDAIKDFNAAADTVRIENLIFTAVSGTGTLTAAQFYQGTAAHDADDRIVYDRTSGALMYDADGNGAGAAVTFATITNKVAMTNADFVVI